MGRTAGDGQWVRGTRRVALAAVVLLAACGGVGGDGEDDDAAEPPPTSATPSEETGGGAAETTTTAPGTTTTVGALPEGSVAVPIDPDLVDRLPRFRGYDRLVSDDPAFDERLCDGEKAPTVPEAQAEASYQLRPTETLSIAGYRFAEGVAPYYISLYSDAVRRCADDVGERESLGLNEGSGFGFRLATERGDAFIAVALADDVMWVLFQERTDGPTEVDETVFAAFARAVES